MAFKNVNLVLLYHERSVAQALVDLFPNIGLERSKFNFVHKFWKNTGNRRNFFEIYAKERGFDPLNPEEWYKQPRESIIAEKGASAIMLYHENSVVKTLMDLFPNIGLQKSKFVLLRGSWKTEENRRQFFIDYAKANGFDPLIASNWYAHSKGSMLAVKGAQNVLSYHNNTVATALLELFPNIGLDPHKLGVAIATYSDPTLQRKVFEDYAQENQFDPLQSRNWYLQPKSKILAAKGVKAVIVHHDNDIPKALSNIFPDIGLDLEPFPYQLYYWNKIENRTKFFESYAKNNGFDPLHAENWYLQSAQKIMTIKGAHRVAFYHGNSLTKALIASFPNIGLDSNKLLGLLR